MPRPSPAGAAELQECARRGPGHADGMASSTTRLIAALALGGVGLVAGCTDGDSEVALPSPSPSTTTAPPSPTPTPTGPSDTREWATCVSTRASLEVSYPADWTVRDYPGGGGCASFAPEPFEVERGTEPHGMTIRLDVESREYERIRDAYLEDFDLISQRPAEVAGYEATRIEYRSTFGPSGGKGRSVTYLADLWSSGTLVLSTNETDADDPELGREVLDEMAQRLERTG